MKDFLTQNKALSITVVICVAALLGYALYLGVDLTWVPSLLKSVLTGG